MGKKEKSKKTLTDAEQRRLEHFEAFVASMKRQGYSCQNLTISIGFANVFAVCLMILLGGFGLWLYFLIHHKLEYTGINPLVFLIIILLLTVIHELIHGICWSFFTPHHFKDIEFGIMKPSMSPYCTCLVPLKKSQYIFGTVMPLVVLGIIPMAVGLVFGNMMTLLLCIIMTAASAGDIMIICKIVGYKSEAKEIVYMDHPTMAGGVIFEKF